MVWIHTAPLFGLENPKFVQKYGVDHYEWQWDCQLKDQAGSADLEFVVVWVHRIWRPYGYWNFLLVPVGRLITAFVFASNEFWFLSLVRSGTVRGCNYFATIVNIMWLVFLAHKS